MRNLLSILFLINTVIYCLGAQAQQKTDLPPLETILNADGTLNTKAGIEGNFNVKGYQMKTGPNGEPKFIPAQSTLGTETAGDNYWDDQFYSNGVDNYVWAIAISGTDVYVGGGFTDAGGNPNADHIAKWNGSSWEALGSGVNDNVLAIAIKGSDVYVGGSFTTAGGTSANRIAKWNGSSWSALGQGVDAQVYTIAVEPVLNLVYVGGAFLNAGGSSANHIAKWNINTSTWSTLSSGTNDYVYDIQLTGSGMGHIVYMVGSFTQAGGTSMSHVAGWNNGSSSWFALGTGVDDNAYEIEYCADGSLYVGGKFHNAGGISANHIARYNGGWYALGAGVNDDVQAISVYSTDVYAGGSFTTAGGTSAKRIAKWNGSSWSAVGDGFEYLVLSIGVTGTNIYAGGAFLFTGNGKLVNRFAIWDGSVWSATPGQGFPLYESIKEIASSGNNVYEISEGALPFAKWNGNYWQCLEYSPIQNITDIAVKGSDVYVGGNFTEINGSPFSRIAKWNGTNWESLGAGLNNEVKGIAISGSDVYVGGWFTDAGNNPNADYIAKWNGTTWSSLGSGVNDNVTAIAINGSDVYVGGFFTTAGGISVNRIAKWNGDTWSALSGLEGYPQIRDIAISEQSEVYVCGYVEIAGNVYKVAKWNGICWTPLGSSSGSVEKIAIHGNDVYAGGQFTEINSVPANYIARWNGGHWKAMGGGLDNIVKSIVCTGDTTGLYVAGLFENAGNKTSVAIGRNRIPTLQMVLPHSRELVFGNSLYNINWAAMNAPGNVDILLSTDGGTNFNIPVVSGTANTGSYSWSVPNTINTARGKLLIRSSGDYYIDGESIDTFFIAPEPNAQATNLLFSNVQANTMTVSYTAAAGNPTGYLVVRKSGSAPSGTPVDGVIYMKGQTLDNDSIVYVGSGITFNECALTPNTDYYYNIFAYLGSDSLINYRTASPLTGHRRTLYNEPSAQPSNMIFSDLLPNSMTVSYTAAAGSPTGYIAIRSVGSAPAGTPVDGISYTMGQTIGTDSVVYIGSGLSFSQAGLTPNTQYYYKIFSYNGADTLINYRTTAPLDSNRYSLQIEPTSQPTNMIFSNLQTNAYTITFTGAWPRPNGYIAIRRSGSKPAGIPVDGTPYSPGNVIAGDSVVYVDTSKTFNQIGLSAGTDYYYTIYSYNGAGQSVNYLQVSPLDSHRTTLQLEPANQATNLLFTNVHEHSLTISYTAATSNPDGYIAVRRSGAIPVGTPADGTSYSSGQVIGTDSVVYVGNAVTFNQSGLTDSTAYHYKIYSYNGSGYAINYNVTNPLYGFKMTVVSEPSAQPTNLQFSNILPYSLDVSFTAAIPSATGYIALRRAGSAPIASPTDGVTYTTGQAIGADTVVFIGSTNHFSQTSLIPGTDYFYKIYSYNGSDTLINYRSSEPLSGHCVTYQFEPTAQPTNLIFSNIQTNSMRLSFTSAVGNPDGYITLRRSGSAPVAVPVDGQVYTKGQAIGSDSVVQVGMATTFNESGLQSGVEYYYNIFSYNGSGGATNYLTTSPLSGHQATLVVEPSAQPTNPVFTNVKANSLTLSFTPAVGNPAGYLVLRKSGNYPTSFPTDGTVYTAGQVIGSDSVVYSGSSNSFDQFGLTPNTVYYYHIFSYNGTGVAINYLITSPLACSQSTLVNEPSSQATNLQFLSIQSNTMNLSFTAASGGAQGYIVLRNSGIPPDNKPVDGIVYSKGQTIGIDSIVYTGNSTSFEDIGLSSNTQYYYAVFAYNGAGSIINYNIISPLTGTNHTLHPEPVAQPTNLEFQNVMSNSMAVSFTLATGNPDGYIAIMRNGSAPVSSPIDRHTYSAGQRIGQDSVVFVGNSTSNAFELSELISNNRYYFKIFAFNGSDTTTNYLTVSPLSGDAITLVDNQAPTFDSITISQPRFLNNDVTLNAYVRDNMGVKNVLLEYRKGTDSSFTHSVAMDYQSGYWYKKTISGSDITVAGIVYRITAKDNSDNQRVSSGSFMISVQANAITTAIENSRYPSGFPSAEKGQGDRYWYLFSIPVTLPADSNRASQVLRALGTFNQDWKLYDGNGNPAPNASFTPGKAYWLKQITGAAIPIALGAGSIEPAESFMITLPPKQWYLIGTPYPVACTWDDNDSLKGPIRYTGTNYEGKGQSGTTPVLELKPFEGYWVFNLKSTDMNMIIRPKSSGLLMAKPSAFDNSGWTVQFIAKSDGLLDLYNFVGARHDGSFSVDRYDMPELPRMGDFVNISFMHKLDDGNTTAHTIDIVSSEMNGYTWDMIIESNLKEKKVDLNWNIISLPKNYLMSIIDLTNNQLVNFSEKSYSFIRRLDDHPTKFKILIGTKEYVDGEMDKIRAEIPQVFVLHPNFPNPFNPQTTIRYDLAKTGKVELKIYNILGQEVRTLIANQIQETGKYTITWDGRDNSGKQVSSGMYIYRLRTNDFVKSRKMILVR